MLSPRKGFELPELHAYMQKPPDAGELGKLIMSLLQSVNPC